MEAGIRKFGRLTLGERGSIGLFYLRLVELFSYFLIVVVSKYIGGFGYNSDVIFFLFLSAAVIHFYSRQLWETVGRNRYWSHSKMDAAVLWQSSFLDLAVVVVLIYLTGTIESPFLALLTVPIFFASYTFSSKITITYFFAAAIVSVAVLGFLELQGIIPHHSCFSPGGDTFVNGPYYVGSLLVLGAILGLVLFLSNVFQDRLQFKVDRLKQKDRESEDKILELSKLYDISIGLNSVLTLGTMLKIVAKETTLLLSQPWVGIVLYNSHHDIMNSEFVGLRRSDELKFGEKSGSRAFANWIKAQVSLAVIEDVQRNKIIRNDEFIKNSGIQSVIAHPLAAGKQVFGVLLAGDFFPTRFDLKKRRLITILSGQLSVAIEKSRLHDSLKRKIQTLEERITHLDRANTLKSEFVSHVSHELRTPLTSIKAYVETLCNYSDNPNFPQNGQFLDIISKETDRLIRIVESILDISKIEFGQRPLQRRNLSLGKLVQEAIATMKPGLDEKKLRIITKIPVELPRIDADEDLMKEVFINLISNATKYSKEGKTVTIAAVEGAVDVSISVQDEGIGIPNREIDKIFDKYFRVKSQGPRCEGVGLGLAIVKNIVEQHGGTISVSSEENVGSTFTITIPKEHCYNDLLGFIAEVVNAKEELHQMLDLIVRMIAELLAAKTVSLMLLDKNRSELFIKVSYGLDEWIVEQTRVTVGEGISGKVAESGVPIFIDNIEQNDIYACPNNPQYETMSLISVPLFVNGMIVGVINVNNKTSGLPFNKDDMNLLISFSERISKALERVRVVKDSNAFLNDTIEAFQKMLDAQLKTGAIETITDLAVRVARRLGLSEKEVSVIQYVASVHDIGMTKISDEILNKTLQLTNDEIVQIRQHPRTGNELMRPLEFVELVNNIILYHHERIDGLGYPIGLRDGEIPIGARILAVIDAYQSMVMDRAYRKRLPIDTALKEIIDNVNKQFDYEVVEAFLDVLKEKGIIATSQAKEYGHVLRGLISSDAV